jgi:hypothetical protein
MSLTTNSAYLPCNGLTGIETTYVAPEGLEPFEVSSSLSVKYTCKLIIRDVRVNYPRFPSIRPILRTVSKIIGFHFM